MEMKNLTIIRHAHAENNSPTGADTDRRLSSGGSKAALKLGERLKAMGLVPDLILTSAAQRARQTATGMCGALGCSPRIIYAHEALYSAQATDVIDIVRGISNDTADAFLVGHNPTVTGALDQFCPGVVESMQPGAAAHIEFGVDTWAAVTPGGGTLRIYLEPEA